MKIKGIVFDFDGVILDTREYVLGAFEATLRAHDFPVPERSELRTRVPGPLEHGYQNLTGLTEVKHLFDHHVEWQKQNTLLVTPFPDLHLVFEYLTIHNISCSIFSNRRKYSVVEKLKEHSLLHFFPGDLILGPQELTHPKPHPEGIHRALAAWKCKPCEVLMVGDQELDIQAGKNASVHTVGCTYGFAGEAIRMTNPTYVITSFSQLLGLL